MNHNNEGMRERFDEKFTGYWRGESIPDEIKFFIKSETDRARSEGAEKLSEFILPKVQKFIDKVESGRARSKETYADMIEIKDFITAINQPNGSHPTVK